MDTYLCRNIKSPLQGFSIKMCLKERRLYFYSGVESLTGPGEYYDIYTTYRFVECISSLSF